MPVILPVFGAVPRVEVNVKQFSYLLQLDGAQWPFLLQVVNVLRLSQLAGCLLVGGLRVQGLSLTLKGH